MIFREYDNDEVIKCVTVSIRDPWQLQEIERACAEIRTYWQEHCK